MCVSRDGCSNIRHILYSNKTGYGALAFVCPPTRHPPPQLRGDNPIVIIMRLDMIYSICMRAYRIHLTPTVHLTPIDRL